MRKTKKQLVTLGLAVMLAASINMTAFAGQWVQENNDFKYQEDNGSYPVNTWKWIDGNNDGVAECYYFDGNGYMLANTTTPDGYQVNESGAWVVNGAIQTQQMDPHTNPINVATSNTNGEEVMDGKSVAQITLNQELVDMISVNGLDKMPNKTKVEDGYFGPTYVTTYRGSELKFETDSSANYISDFIGTAGQILDNLPENGISLDAFYENTNFENSDNGRKVVASSGMSDQIFGLQTGTYRMTGCRIGVRRISIILTSGSDGNWYIYPNSQAYMK